MFFVPFFFLQNIHYTLSQTLRCVFLQNSQLCRNPILDEPVHDKTYDKTCMTSKNSGQPVHPPSMARIFVYSSLDSLVLL